MIITRFFILWFLLAGGFAGLLFLWRAITKNMVISTTKLIVSGGLAFVFAMFIFLMET